MVKVTSRPENTTVAKKEIKSRKPKFGKFRLWRICINWLPLDLDFARSRISFESDSFRYNTPRPKAKVDSPAAANEGLL